MKIIKTVLSIFILAIIVISVQKALSLRGETQKLLLKEQSLLHKQRSTIKQIKIRKEEILREKEAQEALRKQQEALQKQKEIETQKVRESKNEPPHNPNKTQFVALAFDGSRSNAMWKKTLDFAQSMRAAGTGLDFTYFISGVYLLPKHQKKLYHLGWLRPGRSDISYGDSLQETDLRIQNMNRAVAEGHEIASHLNGHFDGSKWTKEQWLEEIDTFNKIIDNTLPQKIDRSIKLAINSKDIKGIRTPLLSRNKYLYEALKEREYHYDTSKVNKMGVTPRKDAYGIYQFPLVSLRIGGKRTLSMDYNHFVAQTKGKSTLKHGTSAWNKAKQDVLNAYLKYFEKEYYGNRAPVNIGHHFSLWNDGLYWEVMKDFAKEVCSKPKVVCTSYQNIYNQLENKTS